MGKIPPYQKWAREYLEERGYQVDVVERFNCWAGNKNDLFGFGDLIAVKKGVTPQKSRRLIIQVTGQRDHTTRVKKIIGHKIRGKVDDPNVRKRALYSLECGFEIVVFSWKKIKNRWEPRIEAVTKDYFSRPLQ